MEGIHYLGIAYMCIWLMLGFFGFALYQKQRKISSEINDLKERLSHKEGK